MNIQFIRSISETQSWQYYDSKTDVLVFADVDGYAHVNKMLLNAKNWSNNLRLDAPSDSNSMHVVITPAVGGSSAKPILRIVERPVYFEGAANMELVICGNESGYAKLASRLGNVISRPAEDFGDHWHLACEDYVIQPSVGLNARAPLRKWHSSAFGEWSKVICSRQASYMPQSISYMFVDPEPYEEVGIDDVREYLKMKAK